MSGQLSHSNYNEIQGGVYYSVTHNEYTRVWLQMPGLTQSFSAESCSMSEYYDAVEENNAESVSDSSSEVRILVTLHRRYVYTCIIHITCLISHPLNNTHERFVNTILTTIYDNKIYYILDNNNSHVSKSFC